MAAISAVLYRESAAIFVLSAHAARKSNSRTKLRVRFRRAGDEGPQSGKVPNFAVVTE